MTELYSQEPSSITNLDPFPSVEADALPAREARRRDIQAVVGLYRDDPLVIKRVHKFEASIPQSKSLYKQGGTLSSDETNELFDEIEVGLAEYRSDTKQPDEDKFRGLTAARNILFHDHIGQAAKVAAKYGKSTYVEKEDFVQQSLERLSQCIEDFDKSKGMPFTEYVFYMVKFKTLGVVRSSYSRGKHFSYREELDSAGTTAEQSSVDAALARHTLKRILETASLTPKNLAIIGLRNEIDPEVIGDLKVKLANGDTSTYKELLSQLSKGKTHDFSAQNVGEALGTPAGSLRVQQHRVLQVLRKAAGSTA